MGEILLADVASVPTGKHPGLAGADHAVMAVYFALMLAAGYWFSRRQQSREEYFLAGRNMPWFLVGLSLFATLLSTISYLAVPGEMIKHGVGVLAGLLALPVVFLVVGYVVVPFFMRLQVTTAYEYLEIRFDLPTRLFASSLFLAIRIAWMSLVVFTACRAMVRISGIPFVWLVVGLGLVAVVYTTLGGLRAVIWTDVVQFLILLGGALFTVFYVAIDTSTGPIEWCRTVTGVERTSQPVFSLDPFERVTLIGVMIRVFFFWICTAGADQVVIQRYLSTPSASAARRSFACSLVAQVVLTCLLALCGLALLSYYRSNPPVTADDVFPHFIRHELPRGFAGLVVAALLSAAMSSLDSGMNSVSAVVTTDFMRRLGRGNRQGAAEVRSARAITLVVGVLTVGLCLLLDRIPDEVRGNIVDISNQVSGFIVGGLGGLFLVAILQRRCRGPAAIAGTVVGMAVGFVLALGHWFLPLDKPFSWMWIIPASCVMTWLAAGAITFLLRVLSASGGRLR